VRLVFYLYFHFAAQLLIMNAQNGLVYESNYKSGLRIVNASSVTEDPTGAGFYEAAFLDGGCFLLFHAMSS
jgi:hypothetical protein